MGVKPAQRTQIPKVARTATSWVSLAWVAIVLGWQRGRHGRAWRPVRQSTEAAGVRMVVAGVLAVNAARAGRASPGHGGRARAAPSRPGQLASQRPDLE